MKTPTTAAKIASPAHRTNVSVVIKELEDLLKKGNAHASLHDAVNGIPFDQLGLVPNGLPYSIWQLTEHIRIAQWDILEFSRDQHHKSPSWPDSYWPRERQPANAADWKKSVEQITADRKAFIDLLVKAGDAIYTPFPHGDGQSLFREALLIADHNSYHIGEIIVIRRLLGIWK
ncbi:MAG TPA: DinB family protein [Puia sp.]|nr:DinB family protein [Puia sp.]